MTFRDMYSAALSCKLFGALWACGVGGGGGAWGPISILILPSPTSAGPRVGGDGPTTPHRRRMPSRRLGATRGAWGGGGSAVSSVAAAWVCPWTLTATRLAVGAARRAGETLRGGSSTLPLPTAARETWAAPHLPHNPTGGGLGHAARCAVRRARPRLPSGGVVWGWGGGHTRRTSQLWRDNRFGTVEACGTGGPAAGQSLVHRGWSAG